MSRRVLTTVFALLTIAAGIIIRLVPLHLPAVLVKYGGSALYAIMLYWLLSSLTPRGRPSRLALAAILSAIAIECFKLVHRPGLDTFRLTLPGKLLLGRIFSWHDLVAYFLAIALVASLDAHSTYHRRGD